MASLPLLNTQFVGPISAISDDLFGRRKTDRAWEAIGLHRAAIEGPPLFVPYSVEAAFGNALARSTGEEHVGALVGSRLRYKDLGVYSDYVLQAPNLACALRRGIRALPHIAKNVAASSVLEGGYIKLRYAANLKGAVGAFHVSEGILFQLRDLVRNFLGQSWNPKWVELDLPATANVTPLEEYYCAPVVLGAELPAIAIPVEDLFTQNPRRVPLRNAVTFGDVGQQSLRQVPQSPTEICAEVILLQLRAGDLSEEAVALRLDMGRRTLQRKLRQDGTNYREVCKHVFAKRASQLLIETDYSIGEISAHLGYQEPNSFRRAFEEWTGLSPTLYRNKNRSK